MTERDRVRRLKKRKNRQRRSQAKARCHQNWRGLVTSIIWPSRRSFQSRPKRAGISGKFKFARSTESKAWKLWIHEKQGSCWSFRDSIESQIWRRQGVDASIKMSSIRPSSTLKLQSLQWRTFETMSPFSNDWLSFRLKSRSLRWRETCMLTGSFTSASHHSVGRR